VIVGVVGLCGCSGDDSEHRDPNASATTTSLRERISHSNAGTIDAPRLGKDIGFYGAVGFGEVEPDEISYGGVPTGRVFGIVWESWGGDEAVGHGTGYLAPDGAGSAAAIERPATVVAFKLGDCAGDRAYLDVRWFFEEDGQEIDLSVPATYNICDGP
jgi:hypothetical protein